MAGSIQRPLKVLHVVGGMVRGGLETWVMHLLRHCDRTQLQMDVLVHTDQPCAYDEEIRALGSRVLPCLHPRQPWRYASNFRRILRESGPYDVVHSHVHHFSGYVLRLAAAAGVPVRLVHSHSDSSSTDAQANLLRQLYHRQMVNWIQHYATVGIAASQKAAAALFGPNWSTDARWQILYCGIDLTPFRAEVDAAALRQELGLPAQSFVIGHAGKFIPLKNHTFLLELLCELRQQQPDTYLVLAGEGPLRAEIEQQAQTLGVADYTRFLGSRPDLPRVMRGAMDLFVLPSRLEGLPLVGLEAQAAGLPILFSDAITDEVDVVKPLVQRLSLSQPLATWVEAVQSRRQARPPLTQVESLATLEKSAFNIAQSLQSLTRCYRSGLQS